MTWDGVIKGMPLFAKELIARGVAGGIAKTAVAPLEPLNVSRYCFRIAVTSRSSEASTSKVSKTRVKVPEPNAFEGARSAKELENFLWDVEQYFLAAAVPDEEEVSITSMYLSDELNFRVWGSLDPSQK